MRLVVVLALLIASCTHGERPAARRLDPNLFVVAGAGRPPCAAGWTAWQVLREPTVSTFLCRPPRPAPPVPAWRLLVKPSPALPGRPGSGVGVWYCAVTGVAPHACFRDLETCGLFVSGEYGRCKPQAAAVCFSAAGHERCYPTAAECEQMRALFEHGKPNPLLGPCAETR